MEKLKEKRFSLTVMITRAGAVAALYAVLTFVFGPIAYGPLQIRPAEALCILPLFFPESIFGLYIGCMLANVISGYGAYDIFLGSAITLAAAAVTYLIGRLLNGNLLSAIIGGLPPVLFNAIGIPFVIILADPECTSASYWVFFFQLLLTQSVWIYALGIPLYYSVRRLREKNIRYFL